MVFMEISLKVQFYWLGILYKKQERDPKMKKRAKQWACALNKL